MPEQPPKPPLPRWFWLTLGLLAGGMLASLVAALWLPQPPMPSHPAKTVAAPARALPAAGAISPMAPMSPTVTEFLSVPEEAPAAETASSTTPPPAAAVSATEPLWRRNSKAAAYAQVQGPRLAIVIDDMGVAPEESEVALTLPPAVTMSFLAYGAATARLAPEAFENGHEILLHLPMEPLPHKNLKLDPGPDTLQVGDAPDVILAKLEHHLSGLAPLIVGVNNHMGSRFTGWTEGMRTVLEQLDAQGYLFLDSLTISPTATRQAAQGLNLPLLKRDVFLDHDPAPASINHELDRAVALATKQGFAIAIGHPLSTTLAVLQDRLPGLKVTLVPLTAGLPAAAK